MNQFNFIKENVKIIDGPLLEIGSKDYGNTQDLRPLFPHYEYIRVDQTEGDTVDIVLDLINDFDTISTQLSGRTFNTIICFSVLEHCSNPFKMSANISRLLNKKGLIFISVPFSWRIHGYPSDYWRFTPEGIKILFPDFDFNIYKGNLSTNVIGEVGEINDYMMRIELDVKKGLERELYGYFAAFLIRLQRRLKIIPRYFSYQYCFPPVMVNMIGVKT